MQNNLIDEACALADRGYALLPCGGRDGKAPLSNAALCKHPGRPCAPHGVKDATTNTETIRRWWSRHPDANIGVALGKASKGRPIVIDVDHPRAVAAIRSQIHQLAQKTVIVKTGRGIHLWICAAPGAATATRLFYAADTGERLGELRGDGAYVLVPPSLHVESGKRYAYEGEGLAS